MTHFPAPRTPLASPGAAPHAPPAVPTAEARERVVEALARYFADDGISMEEYERRVEVAYRAGAMAELDALVADVPRLTSSGGAGTELATGTVPAPSRRVSVMSSHERGGSWTVPRYLKVVAVMSNVEARMSRSRLPPGH